MDRRLGGKGEETRREMRRKRRDKMRKEQRLSYGVGGREGRVLERIIKRENKTDNYSYRNTDKGRQTDGHYTCCSYPLHHHTFLSSTCRIGLYYSHLYLEAVAKEIVMSCDPSKSLSVLLAGRPIVTHRGEVVQCNITLLYSTIRYSKSTLRDI